MTFLYPYDRDLDPVTMTIELDWDAAWIYPAEQINLIYEDSSKLSSGRTDRQTHTQTDTAENITVPHKWAVMVMTIGVSIIVHH